MFHPPPSSRVLFTRPASLTTPPPLSIKSPSPSPPTPPPPPPPPHLPRASKESERSGQEWDNKRARSGILVGQLDGEVGRAREQARMKRTLCRDERVNIWRCGGMAGTVPSRKHPAPALPGTVWTVGADLEVRVPGYVYEVSSGLTD